jgi:hypothetical protein
VDTIDWLLDSDPAIRWQVMRDLTNASEEAVAAEQVRVAREGVGAEILVRQETDGSWGAPNARLWKSTLFTLLFLRRTGVDPADPAVKRALARPQAKLRWNDGETWDLGPAELGGNPFFEGEVEPCINGGVLAFGAYFGHPSQTLAKRLVDEQLEDGGWNCEAPKSRRSSFHTTICVLEGLLEYERAVGTAPQIAAARKRGEEYLLDRGLFRRRSTGEIANAKFLELAFPPHYHYDILRALDYFRAAGVQPDSRMSDAVHIVESKRPTDARWLLERSYDEALAVPFTEKLGEPSRWNTLRALRVLKWWKGWVVRQSNS